MNSNSESSLSHYDNSLQELRTQINLLDEQIAALLKERLSLVLQAREIKMIDGIPAHSTEREQVIVANVIDASVGLEREYLADIYQALLTTTRQVADKKRKV